MNSTSLNEEASIRIIGKITLLVNQLEQDLSLQIDVKNAIDEILYDYEVQTKCTSLVTSDILQKAKLYVSVKKLEGLSSKTIYNYALFLHHFDEFFHKPCSTVTTMDLRMYLSTISEGKKASTVNGYITCMKNFFGWLQNEEYLMKNPAAKLKPTKTPKLILEGYKAENLEKLRDACTTDREKVLFEVIESTACRISEVTNIKVSDINWNEQSILVIGKGNKQRIVYFSTRAKLAMETYIKSRPVDAEYLFISDRKPYLKIKTRAMQLILKGIQKKSGVTERVHAHKFRRTQATTLLNSGMSLQGVQKILGHSSPETSQRYAQLSQENLKNEYRRLIH